MSSHVKAELAALRRYGALLIGSKTLADDHLERALSTAEVRADDRARDLYRLFHTTPPSRSELQLDEFESADHQLLQALHKLSFEDRALLLLTGMAQLERDRVAAIFDCSVFDVSQRLARARSLMIAGYQNRLCVIVEDDLITMRDLRAELAEGRLGIAGTAKNRREAFNLSEQLRPDIAFIDLALPEGATAGADVAERLRDRYGPRIVFVTAFAKLAKELARSGDMIVPKPWSAGLLKNVIARAIA